MLAAPLSESLARTGWSGEEAAQQRNVETNSLAGVLFRRYLTGMISLRVHVCSASLALALTLTPIITRATEAIAPGPAATTPQEVPQAQPAPWYVEPLDAFLLWSLRTKSMKPRVADRFVCALASAAHQEWVLESVKPQSSAPPEPPTCSGNEFDRRDALAAYRPQFETYKADLASRRSFHIWVRWAYGQYDFDAHGFHVAVSRDLRIERPWNPLSLTEDDHFDFVLNMKNADILDFVPVAEEKARWLAENSRNRHLAWIQDFRFDLEFTITGIVERKAARPGDYPIRGLQAEIVRGKVSAVTSLEGADNVPGLTQLFEFDAAELERDRARVKRQKAMR